MKNLGNLVTHIGVCVVMGAGVVALSLGAASAQDADPEATIAALQTQVAELQGTPNQTPTTVSTPAADEPVASGDVNLELILDVSGSMAQVLPTGETRMDAAKRVMQDVVAGIPDREGINVGLRVYGHEGNNTQEGAAVSCVSSELVVPIQGVEKDSLNAEVTKLLPTGWTPIGLSLERAGEDFSTETDAALNYIVLVTDGLETCGGDPVLAAANLHNGPSNVITSVVGFGLTPPEQETIAQIAQAGAGEVLGASDATELSDALFTVLSTPVPDIATPEPIINSAEFGDWSVTMTGAQTVPTVSAVFQSFTARGQFVIVTLNVLNNGSTPKAFPYSDLRLQDSAGRTFSIDTDPTIPYQIEVYGVAMYDQLQPGLPYDTAVVFDVPADSTGFVLNPASGASWLIPVSPQGGTTP